MMIGILSELNPEDRHPHRHGEGTEVADAQALESPRAGGAEIAGRIPTTLLTHSLPLEQTPKAFEMLTHYTDGVGKAVISVLAGEFPPLAQLVCVRFLIAIVILASVCDWPDPRRIRGRDSRQNRKAARAARSDVGDSHFFAFYAKKSQVRVAY